MRSPRAVQDSAGRQSRWPKPNRTVCGSPRPGMRVRSRRFGHCRRALAPPLESDPRWGAVVDGWLLPDTIDQVPARGGQNHVAMLTGLNADEGSSATNYGKIPAADFTQQSRERFGARADSFLSLYPVKSDHEASRSQIDAAREQGLVSTYLWGVLRAKTSRAPLFTYYWIHALPGPDRELYRAFHTSEAPDVFNSLHRLNRPFEPADRVIATTMSSYWKSFASSGDPNGPGLAPWPAFRAGTPVTMELGIVSERVPSLPLRDWNSFPGISRLCRR